MIDAPIDLTDGQRDRLNALSFPVAELLPAEYPVDAALALAGLAKVITVGDREMTAATEVGIRAALRAKRSASDNGEEEQS